MLTCLCMQHLKFTSNLVSSLIKYHELYYQLTHIYVVGNPKPLKHVSSSLFRYQLSFQDQLYGDSLGNMPHHW